MRKDRYIYRKEKRAEDESMPLSETGPTEARHVSWALNVSQIKDPPNDHPTSLGPKN